MIQNVKNDFFISYHKADVAWAQWIAWELEEAGYTAVLQAWDYRPGGNFIVEMQEAISTAERTVVVLSPDYLDSFYVKPEWEAAFNPDQTGETGILIPVRVRQFDPEGFALPIVYVDLVGLSAPEARSALLGGVSRGRAKPEAIPSFPGYTHHTDSPARHFPATLPSVWNVPHNRNPHFTGREDLLHALRLALTAGRPAALTQVIHGLGGVGKSQLAAEYAYQHAGDYEIVWWVRSEEPAALAADYAALAAELELPEAKIFDQALSVQAVRNWLGRNAGWLLIFDNANRREEIAPYLPAGNAGHVIITSRDRDWKSLAEPLQVSVMPRSESVAYLLKRTAQTDDDAASALAEELGDLPLALEQAGAYIDAAGETLAGYLELFRTHHQRLLSRGTPSTNYPATAATTWNISFAEVHRQSPVSEDLINLFAFFAPDAIPLEVIRAGSDVFPERLAAVLADPVALDDALAPLLRYSLAERRGQSLFIHRLVQASVREGLTEVAQKLWVHAALLLVHKAFPTEGSDVRSLPVCDALLPHALVVTEHAARLEMRSETEAALLNRVGLYLYKRADFDRAHQALSRALESAQESGGDSVEVAVGLGNLGRVRQSQGNLNDARRFYERALEIFNRELGPHHSEVIRITADLGALMQELGEFRTARVLLEEALSAADSVGSRPETVLALNNLGLLLMEQGEEGEALRVLTRALSHAEALYGPDHPTVVIVIRNLGQGLLKLGDILGAQAYFERALVVDEAAFGGDHPYVAKDARLLGDALRLSGALTAARAYIERSLAINEAAFGPWHPEIASDLSSLGQILRGLGDTGAARGYFERALAIDESAFGAQHPRVAIDLNNVGEILQLLGDAEGARAAFSRALDILKTFFPESHPNILLVRNNLSSLSPSTEALKPVKLVPELVEPAEEEVSPDPPTIPGTADGVRRLTRDVFKEVGLPSYTYVKPDCYAAVREDLLLEGKHVLIQGPSGTGKTSLLMKILQELNWERGRDFQLILCRPDNDHEARLEAELARALSGQSPLKLVVVDDFHLLTPDFNTRVGISLKELSDLSFFDDRVTKFALLGIPGVGRQLLKDATDLLPRIGIHSLDTVSDAKLSELISRGENVLNITFDLVEDIKREAGGSFRLCQMLCRLICMENGVVESSTAHRKLRVEILSARHQLRYSTESAYMQIATTFAKGTKWSPNGHKMYLSILLALREVRHPVASLDAVAAKLPSACRPGLKLIRRHLPHVIYDPETKRDLRRYIFYDEESENFVIDDLLFSYFLRHLDQTDLLQNLGMEAEQLEGCRAYPYEVGFSFAAECRPLVEEVNSLLRAKDVLTWYDYDQQAVLLGSDLQEVVQRIYSKSCRYYLVFLEPSYREKVWTRFETDIMTHSKRKNHVIPVVLDVEELGRQVGIPATLGHVNLSEVWARFKQSGTLSDHYKKVMHDLLVLPVAEKIDSEPVEALP